MTKRTRVPGSLPLFLISLLGCAAQRALRAHSARRRAELLWLMAVGFAFLMLACHQPPERRYEVKGTVVAVDPQHKEITLQHGDILGYMKAMTMPFSLKEEWPYTVLTAGDHIQAVLVVQGDRSWLEELSITRSSGNLGESLPTETQREFSSYRAPDFTLTDQDGHVFTLASQRGKIVVLDFIFTRCPGPCPLLSLKFSQLQQRLGQRLGKEIMLVSVTIDPQHDTPGVLKEYARRYSANLSGWKFLAGNIKETTRLTSALGFNFEANQEGIVNHRLVTYLLSREGMVMREFTGTDYTVDEIMAEIDKQKP